MRRWPRSRRARSVKACANSLAIDHTITAVDPRTAGRQFLKYAPPGYRAATGYADGGNPYLRVDDTYHCALKGGMPAGTVLKSDPPAVGWGKILAAALRQPLMSGAIGLVRCLHRDAGSRISSTAADGST